MINKNNKIKRITLLLSFCLLMFQGEIFSQRCYGENGILINCFDADGKKQGNWLEKYFNGETRYKGQFNDDIPYGVFYHYRVNGKLNAVVIYDDNGNKYKEIFDENGRLRISGLYNSDNEIIKTEHIYLDDGSIARIINKEDGSVVAYYAGTNSKSKEMECTYKNGKLIYQKFYENGNYQEIGSYENGVRHGYWKYFSPEGVCEAEGEYIQGKKEGNWKIWNQEKKEYKIINYKNGINDEGCKINNL